MNARPGVRRRAVVALALALAFMAGVALWLLVDFRDGGFGVVSPAAESAPRIGAGDRLAVARGRGPYRTHPELTDYTADEARAYALLGQLDDGAIAKLPPLSEAIAAELEPMRSFLDEDRPIPGDGKTVVSPRGSFTIARKRSDERIERPLGGSGETTAAIGQAPRHAEFIQMSGDIALTSEGQVITGKGVWAAIRFDPTVQPSVRLINRGEGGYVFCLRGKDFGSVRVNGGLAVPGRYYVIDGPIDISSQVAIGIEICPLVATWNYYATPLPPPRVNG
jgi:hypothetical protein